MGRFLDGVDVVDVANGLYVREDARADHEGQEMDGHQEGGAHTEGDDQASRYVSLYPDLHQRNLKHSIKK